MVKSIYFVVGIPLLIMALWLALLVTEITGGVQVNLPVTGSDPRDFLRGHFITYRVNYNVSQTSQKGWSEDSEDACLCLTDISGGHEVTERKIVACSLRDDSTCPLFIKGSLKSGEFRAGIERFYIPEQYQSHLARLPEESSIQIRVTRRGNAYVTNLYLKGVPLRDVARANGW